MGTAWPEPGRGAASCGVSSQERSSCILDAGSRAAVRDRRVPGAGVKLKVIEGVRSSNGDQEMEMTIHLSLVTGLKMSDMCTVLDVRMVATWGRRGGQ